MNLEVVDINCGIYVTLEDSKIIITISNDGNPFRWDNIADDVIPFLQVLNSKHRVKSIKIYKTKWSLEKLINDINVGWVEEIKIKL